MRYNVDAADIDYEDNPFEYYKYILEQRGFDHDEIEEYFKNRHFRHIPPKEVFEKWMQEDFINFCLEQMEREDEEMEDLDDFPKYISQLENDERTDLTSIELDDFVTAGDEWWLDDCSQANQMRALWGSYNLC